MSAVVHLGDCLEVMRGMEAKSVDLVLTDIPYGEVNRTSGGLRSLDRAGADIETFPLAAFTAEVARVCRGSVYVFCGRLQYSDLDRDLQAAGFSTRCIVWEKTNPSPMNGQYLWLNGVELCVFGKRARATFNGVHRNTVLKCATQPSEDHPTQKPLGLFKELIRLSSKPGDVVFDPCMGSGTSGVAALEEGRKFIGVELDPAHHATATRRIAHAQPALLGVS